jgi:hydrophobic/amphiphilic exporter-1 (mainly G- bacteria), HAE1 family
MAQFFIRRPIVAMVISIIIVIVGVFTLSRLPIAEYPSISPTLITVASSYRGAAAEAVMDSVAIPIESQVNGVDKMLYMQSYSANDGTMTLSVTFDVGTDVDIMQVNTQNRVSQAQAQLPDAVKREGVTVNRVSPDLLFAIGLYSPKGTYDAIFLGNYANINLVDAIKRVSGVGDVKNFTAQDYSMRIWVQPDKMAALGITPEEIAAAVREMRRRRQARLVQSRLRPGKRLNIMCARLGCYGRRTSLLIL